MARLIFTLATSGGYSTGDFTDGDGYSVTSVVANGADWDITMSGPSGTATKTFTDAQLSQPVVHNVVPPAITENPAGTFTATDGGGWFYDDTLLSAGEVEFTLQWVIGGNVVGTGLTFTKTDEAQDYQDIDFVVTPSYGEAATVRAQEVADYVPNLFRPSGSAVATYSGAGGYSDIGLFAFSMRLDPVLDAFSYMLRFSDVGSSRVDMYTANNGEFLVNLRDEDGTLLSSIARSGSGVSKAGLTVCGLILAQRGVGVPGEVQWRYRDSGGGTGSNSTALAADKRLGFAPDILMGAVTTAQQQAYHRFAYWELAGMPSRTASEIFDDLFNADSTPKNPAIANTYLGAPKWDQQGPAAQVNAGAHDGSWAGTGSVPGTFIDVT